MGGSTLGEGVLRGWVFKQSGWLGLGPGRSAPLGSIQVPGETIVLKESPVLEGSSFSKKVGGGMFDPRGGGSLFETSQPGGGGG